jgi:hypothetical protein
MGMRKGGGPQGHRGLWEFRLPRGFFLKPRGMIPLRSLLLVFQGILPGFFLNPRAPQRRPWIQGPLRYTGKPIWGKIGRPWYPRVAGSYPRRLVFEVAGSYPRRLVFEMASLAKTAETETMSCALRAECGCTARIIGVATGAAGSTRRPGNGNKRRYFLPRPWACRTTVSFGIPTQLGRRQPIQFSSPPAPGWRVLWWSPLPSRARASPALPATTSVQTCWPGGLGFAWRSKSRVLALTASRPRGGWGTVGLARPAGTWAARDACRKTCVRTVGALERALEPLSRISG